VKEDADKQTLPGVQVGLGKQIDFESRKERGKRRRKH